MINANEENFNKIIQEGHVLVDFYATWCGPCKMLESELEDICSKIKIVKINVDENSNLCKKYGIMSVPTLIYFKTPEIYDKKTGFIPQENILNWIENID